MRIAIAAALGALTLASPALAQSTNDTGPSGSEMNRNGEIAPGAPVRSDGMTEGRAAAPVGQTAPNGNAGAKEKSQSNGN